jgi:signal peptidase I
MEIPGRVLNTNQADFLELSQRLLDRGALLRFQAHGRSMYPFIKHGDIIVIEPRNGSTVSIGDVIFYRKQDGSTIAHRLVKVSCRKDKTVLLTKGDALKYTDLPVSPAQVMGRVILIEGRGRKLKLNGWTGRMFGRFVAWMARRHYPNQRRIVRYIDRLGWLLLGRRTK